MKYLIIMLFIYAQSSIALFDSNKNLLELEKRTIKVYKDVTPSVVNITNIAKFNRRSLFFNMSSGETQTGAGTGFVWDSQGHIITNYHVVSDRNSKFMISFKGSKERLEAKVIGVEPKLDIAVLKVKSLPSSAKPISPGSSHDLQVGQIAMAIGNPFELDYSISKGIISALGRKIQGIGGVEIHNMIQTDATINPGNSGGPLLNSSGKLIGMNTLIYSKSGASDGIGFAVPVDDIKLVVPDLIRYGKVKRPALGISLLSDRQAAAIRAWGMTDEKNGIIVGDVLPRSNAKKAGIKGISQKRNGDVSMGDIILKIEGIKVQNYNDIYHALRKFSIGDTVKVTIRRNNGKKETKRIKLQELKE